MQTLTTLFNLKWKTHFSGKIYSKKELFNMKIITNELIKKYEEFLFEEEKAPATIEKYIRDVVCFMNWLCGRSVEKAVVMEYKNMLIETYAPKSVNSIISSLNSFFNYNEWFKCKTKAVKIQKQIFAKTEKELTKAEYERLLKAAKEQKNDRLYYLMQTICTTGIRISELRFISVAAVKSGKAEINCKGKLRTVFLPKGLCRVLKEYIKRHNITEGSVFITKTGKPIDRSNVWSDMKRLCESAGVSKDKVFPHNLRHLFARTYYSLQKDIVRLADILGHTNVNTTRIYTMETGVVHRKQMEKLGLLLC